MTDIVPTAQINHVIQQAAPVPSPEAVLSPDNLHRIDEAAKDFEAMFITEMLRPMFEGIEPDPLFGGGKGEEVFRSLMLSEYGKSIADAGGLGIAEHVKAEMIRIQEAAGNSGGAP